MKAMKVVDLKIACKVREHSPDTGLFSSIFWRQIVLITTTRATQLWNTMGC